MSKTAVLKIELRADCPQCGDYFDILDTPINEEGYIIDQVLPNLGDWASAFKDFDELITCPECGFEFCVKGVEWL